jgi:hypothetical protein
MACATILADEAILEQLRRSARRAGISLAEATDGCGLCRFSLAHASRCQSPCSPPPWMKLAPPAAPR